MKKKIKLLLLIIVIFTSFPTATNNNSIIGEALALKLSDEELVKQEFLENPIMIEIAKCESGLRQFGKDGNVLRGEINNEDVGLFQINESYHLERANELGIDIYSSLGNITFAKLLYKEQNVRPWNWSKHCWGK